MFNASDATAVAISRSYRYLNLLSSYSVDALESAAQPAADVAKSALQLILLIRAIGDESRGEGQPITLEAMAPVLERAAEGTHGKGLSLSSAKGSCEVHLAEYLEARLRPLPLSPPAKTPEGEPVQPQTYALQVLCNCAGFLAACLELCIKVGFQRETEARLQAEEAARREAHERLWQELAEGIEAGEEAAAKGKGRKARGKKAVDVAARQPLAESRALGAEANRQLPQLQPEAPAVKPVPTQPPARDRDGTPTPGATAAAPVPAAASAPPQRLPPAAVSEPMAGKGRIARKAAAPEPTSAPKSSAADKKAPTGRHSATEPRPAAAAVSSGEERQGVGKGTPRQLAPGDSKAPGVPKAQPQPRPVVAGASRAEEGRRPSTAPAPRPQQGAGKGGQQPPVEAWGSGAPPAQVSRRDEMPAAQARQPAAQTTAPAAAPAPVAGGSRPAAPQQPECPVKAAMSPPPRRLGFLEQVARLLELDPRLRQFAEERLRDLGGAPDPEQCQTPPPLERRPASGRLARTASRLRNNTAEEEEEGQQQPQHQEEEEWEEGESPVLAVATGEEEGVDQEAAAERRLEEPLIAGLDILQEGLEARQHSFTPLQDAELRLGSGRSETPDISYRLRSLRRPEPQPETPTPLGRSPSRETPAPMYVYPPMGYPGIYQQPFVPALVHDQQQRVPTEGPGLDREEDGAPGPEGVPSGMPLGVPYLAYLPTGAVVPLMPGPMALIYPYPAQYAHPPAAATAAAAGAPMPVCDLQRSCPSSSSCQPAMACVGLQVMAQDHRVERQEPAGDGGPSPHQAGGGRRHEAGEIPTTIRPSRRDGRSRQQQQQHREEGPPRSQPQTQGSRASRRSSRDPRPEAKDPVEDSSRNLPLMASAPLVYLMPTGEGTAPIPVDKVFGHAPRDKPKGTEFVFGNFS